MSELVVDVEMVMGELDIEYDMNRASHGWINVHCPFHDENRPSFGINYVHGGWVDRHDGQTGNVVRLVERIKGLSNQEAYRWVRSKKPKTILSIERLRRALGKEPEEDESTGDLQEWQQRYAVLDPTVMAKYWFDRGFDTKMMIKFEIRYDPDARAMVFPIKDFVGDIIGMALRRANDVHQPKYLYNDGFPRGRSLFPMNYFRATEVVLVEGPLDAIWLHQCGFEHVLCTFGAMTREQIEMLRPMVSAITLAFDNDSAGRESLGRVIPKLAGKFHLKLVDYPDGIKDPQEMSIKDVRDMIGYAMPLLGHMLKSGGS